MKWNVNSEERTGLVHLQQVGRGGCKRSLSLSGTVMVEALESVQPDSFASINTGQRRLSFIPKAFQPQQNWSTPKDSVRAGNRMEMPRRIVTFFFDVMLEDLVARGIVDADLVFSIGHSNGGGFTYNLLVERGKRLAAIAPLRTHSPPSIDTVHFQKYQSSTWPVGTIDWSRWNGSRPPLTICYVSMTANLQSNGMGTLRLLGVRVERGPHSGDIRPPRDAQDAGRCWGH